MNKLALFLKNKTLPGRWAEVYRLWEKHLKARVEASPFQEVYFFCLDDNDVDTLCIFELYTDWEAMQQSGQAAWFADYLKEVGPLLSGESDFAMTAPVWAKGAAL